MFTYYYTINKNIEEKNIDNDFFEKYIISLPDEKKRTIVLLIIEHYLYQCKLNNIENTDFDPFNLKLPFNCIIEEDTLTFESKDIPNNLKNIILKI